MIGHRKAIILFEDESEDLSTIIGLNQIRSPIGHITTTFEEIRRVLERKGTLKI
jgi:hypothetical protein